MVSEKLSWLNSIVECQIHVVRHLEHLITGNQGSYRHDAAVARRESRAAP
jgi:hypothetical protein